jgi:leucyl aminopeptidase
MDYVTPPDLKIDVSAKPFALSVATLARADAAIVLLERAPALDKTVAKLPHAALWRRLLQAHQRNGKDAPILVSRLPNRSHTLVAVGFVKAGASGFERLELAGKLASEVVKPGVARVQLHAGDFKAPGERSAALEAALSAVLAHAAPMPEQKSKPTPPCAVSRIEIAHRASPEFERSVAVAEGNHLARWLAALPPNVLDSVAYRAALQKLARREGWAYRFYGIEQLEQLEAGAFLAVARANPHREAGIVRLTYKPKALRKGANGIALVGKGICFDTGGINLKAHKGMYLMHGDMQGSAVAVGTLLACARSGLGVDVDCWLALTENETGPRAYRPQDIVRASNGVTIQVVHSDAEGRMVLADTLALASREKPGLLLDFATLTGACVNALTDRYSGAFTNRPDLHARLQQVGSESGERVWCFPMDEDFDLELECAVADVLQCTLESKGDHILAARFLSKFVAAGLPWVHIDLAAAEHKGGLGHVPTEFTGFGVRYALRLLNDQSFMAQVGKQP